MLFESTTKHKLWKWAIVGAVAGIISWLLTLLGLQLNFLYASPLQPILGSFSTGPFAAVGFALTGAIIFAIGAYVRVLIKRRTPNEFMRLFEVSFIGNLALYLYSLAVTNLSGFNLNTLIALAITDVIGIIMIWIAYKFLHYPVPAD